MMLWHVHQRGKGEMIHMLEEIVPGWRKMCSEAEPSKGKLARWACFTSEPEEGMPLCLIKGRNCFKKRHENPIVGIDVGKKKTKRNRKACRSCK